MQAASGSRLDSWKEIAEYLHRNVRTVTRWAADRKLPVHHIPGGKRGHVFAYTSELDSWLMSQDAEPLPGDVPGISEGKDKSPAGAVPESRLKGASGGPLRWQAAWVRSTVLFAGILIAVAAAGAYVVFRTAGDHGAELFSVKYGVDSLQGLDADGHVLWTQRFPNSTLVNHIGKRSDGFVPILSRVGDFFRDGHREAATIISLRHGLNPGLADHNELDLITSTGKILWSYFPKKTFIFGGQELKGPWQFKEILVSEAGDQTMFWVCAGHHTWGDSFVARIDARTGQDAVRFVNTGVLHSLNEVKTSTGWYVLTGGFNNEWDGGSLAIFKEDGPFASSPQTPGSRHFCNSCPAGGPDYYFVFPRSEINRLSGVYENPVLDINIAEDGIEIKKYARIGKGGENTIYLFSSQPPFKLLSVRYDSDYDMLHRRWSAEGKLPHTLENCPERLHPPPVRLWTRENGWTEIPVPPAPEILPDNQAKKP